MSKKEIVDAVLDIITVKNRKLAERVYDKLSKSIPDPDDLIYAIAEQCTKK
jgi:hypothetical protein